MGWKLFILDSIYRVVRQLSHFFFALINGFYGRKVPPVKDPTLLLSATELANRIREGKLTSTSVVKAYISRILEVEPYINATVDSRFKDALDEAKEADALVSSGALTAEQLKKDKPLLGVPFSIKILITAKGMRCTAGSLLFKDLRAQEDSAAVALMKKAGAIALVNTNSAECGMNFQTSNYIHGTTRNPYDTSRTSGGSSGGESALVGAAGSVIGLGNDMGGSIRVPCMFTGLFGHKPSRGLVSNEGCFPTPDGKAQRLLYTGPMCRYAEDLLTTMKILSSSDEINLRFGDKVDLKNIKVYYLFSFGNNLPFTENVDPEIKDAIRKVVSHFQKQGSNVKEICIPLFRSGFSIYFHSLLSSVLDVGKTLSAGMQKLDGLQELLKFFCFKTNFTLGYIIGLISKRIPFLYNPNLVDFYKGLEDKLDTQLNSLLDENSVLVMPTIPFPAPYHNEIMLLIPSTSYTSIFNTLGLPSTQCPVGFNKQGLPIGVQVLSKQGNDPLTVACALEIEKTFGGWKEPK